MTLFSIKIVVSYNGKKLLALGSKTPQKFLLTTKPTFMIKKENYIHC